jgi:hypothetical protein
MAVHRAHRDTGCPNGEVFYLKKPMAAFLTETLFTPIVQEGMGGCAEKAKKPKSPWPP